MVYEVPKSKASIDQNVFKFRIPGDRKVYSLPKQQYLTADFRFRMGEMAGKAMAHKEAGTKPSDEEAQQMAAVQREIFEHYIPGLYERLDGEQLQDLAKAWGEASSVSLGESSASLDS